MSNLPPRIREWKGGMKGPLAEAFFRSREEKLVCRKICCILSFFSPKNGALPCFLLWIIMTFEKPRCYAVVFYFAKNNRTISVQKVKNK